MKNRKIYIVGGGRHYVNWMQGNITHDIREADLVVFTGGEDVSPYMYESAKHPLTWANARRDEFEKRIFDEAMKLQKKMVGICRGAQFLCVMAGGSLVQHQAHPIIHIVETNEKRVVVTSAHHQRQYPWGRKKPSFELVAWCNNLSPINEGVNQNDDLSGHPEVEIAIYPNIRALAIQSHPEFAFPPNRMWERQYIAFCRKTLNSFMRRF